MNIIKKLFKKKSKPVDEKSKPVDDIKYTNIPELDSIIIKRLKLLISLEEIDRRMIINGESKKNEYDTICKVFDKTKKEYKETRDKHFQSYKIQKKQNGVYTSMSTKNYDPRDDQADIEIKYTKHTKLNDIITRRLAILISIEEIDRNILESCSKKERKRQQKRGKKKWLDFNKTTEEYQDTYSTIFCNLLIKKKKY